MEVGTGVVEALVAVVGLAVEAERAAAPVEAATQAVPVAEAARRVARRLAVAEAS